MAYNYNYSYNTNWATNIQSNPALYPNPPSLRDPYSSILHPSLPQNPNPDSYSYSISYGSGHETQQQQQQQGLVFTYGGQSSISEAAATSVYYQDPIVLQNLGAIEPFRVNEVAAVSRNGAKKLTPANVNSNIYGQHLRNGSWKKGLKKIKIQSVWCDVCKLEFNSKLILDQHKSGKRHKKGLEKLQGGGVAAVPTSAPLAVSQVSVNGQSAGKKAVKPVENLETKTRKVLEGGAATNEVRICHACNVVCNSETVFQTHITGKKHIANISKQQNPASAALVPSEASVNTFIGPQPKPGMVNLGNRQDAVSKAAELMQNFETKRRKVLEGGAAANEVRMCHACNVICNSETVFRTHLTGKKHISNMKKQASGAGVAPAI